MRLLLDCIKVTGTDSWNEVSEGTVLPGRAIAPIIDRLKATCDTHRPLEARVCEARREIIEHG
jgi:hypothetical protein